MRSRFRADLEVKLRNPAFAKGYGAEAAKTDYAFTLSQARLRTRVTQSELSGRLGTSQSYIAKLERGDANPTIGMAGKILAMLGQRLVTSAVPFTPGEHIEFRAPDIAASLRSVSTLLSDDYGSPPIHPKTDISNTNADQISTGVSK